MPDNQQTVLPSLEDARDFSTAARRGPRGDLAAHRARVEAARSLALRAWRDSISSAWATVQVLMYRLQERSHLRPTDAGDVHVLDEVYRIAEQHRKPVPVPDGLSPREFCAYLKQVIEPYAVTSTPVETWLEERAPEDWRFIAYQFTPYAVHFTNLVALASFGLGRQEAALVYENLWDEVGRGAPNQFHFHMLARWATQFGVQLDTEEALDWVLPEAIADFNTQVRILWQRRPAATLASMYLFERLDRVGYGAILRSMERNGLEEQEYFRTHLHVDEAHAADWLVSLERATIDAGTQREALSAVLERAEGLRVVLDRCVSGLARWKETREPRRLPFRELPVPMETDLGERDEVRYAR